MVYRILILLLVMTLPAAADERMSESLADCAAVIALPNLLTPDRAGTKEGGVSAALSGSYRAAAVREATTEGRDDPERFVAKMLSLKQASLVGLGDTFPDQQDYRDRIAFCRAIGATRGVGGGG